MPFGSLSSAQEILIRLYLRGGPQFRAELEKSGIATKGFAASQAELSKQMAISTKRTFMHNQALFMARRALFYTTLGVVGLAASVVKLGFEYNNMTQQAQVGFTKFLGSQVAAVAELHKLYALAALSPFEFPDIVLATRRLLPFTSGVEETNLIVRSLVDSLSSVGILTGAALTRASLAMSHLMSQGTLTGQIMTQMGRDNIPMLQALMYYFHATGQEIHDSVSQRLITAGQAAKALQAYMATPQFKDVALVQATQTLQGAYSTFIDILRIAAGSSEKGMFTGLTKMLQDIDKALMPMVQGGEPITLTKLAKAIDTTLTPSTHALLNTFIFFQAALKSLVGTFWLFFKILQIILWPFNKLGDLFGSAQMGAKLLGTAVGILTALIIINKSILATEAIALEAVKVKQLLLRDSIKSTVFWMKVQDMWAKKSMGSGALSEILFGKKGTTVFKHTPAWKTGTGAAEVEGITVGATSGLIGKLLDTKKIGGFRNAFKSFILDFKNVGFKGSLQKLPGLFKVMGSSILRVAGVMKSQLAYAMAILITESWALFTANLWWLWIPAVILLVVGALVLLYRKWDWFHYLVNDTFSAIKRHWKTMLLFLPVFGQIAWVMVQIVDHWKTWSGWIGTVINQIKALIDWIKKIPSKIPGEKWFNRLVKYSPPFLAVTAAKAAVDNRNQGKRAFNWLTGEDIAPRQRALGGPIFGSGPVLVGERGPEVVMLPGGANVIPNHALGKVNPVGRGRGGNDDRPILVQVMLDRKVLAEGVARANQDYAARR